MVQERKLKFLQWNIFSLMSNRNLLHASLIEDQISVCLLQETLVTNPEQVKLPGFTAHHLLVGERGATRGCLILVKDSIPHRVTELPIRCGEDIEVQAVTLFLDGTELHRVKEMNHRVNRLRKIFRRSRSQANLELLKEAVAHA
ncbi:hypothetical protein E2C01_063392 [Portunus trituberculatus]|uniref:Uncharacterized protein n=1 Tax=Portunus trituberculatus TaxID=210409 RepID=A0A5B7HGX9_PORTR|nr:hypothetical protein [Portunus trituberculatus]